MAYTTINKSTLHFTPKIFTGTGSSQSITGVGFQPDWCWFKNRGVQESHNKYDVVRGPTYRIYSDSSAVQSNSGSSSRFVSFDSDGFTVGGDGMTNGNGASMVAWNWKAGNSQGSSNTDGSINTTYTSVNTTAGFSISQYTGTGSNATVGHGLGAIPEMIIIKEITGSGRNWRVYHKDVGNTKVMYLNTTSAEVSETTAFNSTSPTSSVFSVGTSGGTNDSGNNYIAYCFSPKTGYSKFGRYVGNGNADGTFVYTGFRPEFSMIKPYSTTGNWQIHDTKRDGYNVKNDNLAPNNDATEADNQFMDILSNGFKLRSSTYSANGVSYIYMAFGQSLVGSNNVPCTAR